RKRHHGRTRNCTAWPHRALSESLPHPAAALPHRFDRKATLGIEGSRKLGEEKALELLDCHRHWHPSPSTRATELDDCRQVKKVPGRGALAPHAARNGRVTPGGWFDGAAYPHSRPGPPPPPQLRHESRSVTPCRIACAARPSRASTSSCGKQAGSCRHD